MHNRGPTAAAGHVTGASKERRLSAASFVGSYSAADFSCHPELPQIAFVGRSNVGKSSLLNALLGRRALARTSKTPGKTRALNLYAVGEQFYLVDLPGYGYARAPKTARRGFAKLITDYLTNRQDLAAVVWLLDIRRDLSRGDQAIADLLAGTETPVLVAVTKADKVTRTHRRKRVESILAAAGVPRIQCAITSARTREGIGELVESIEDLVTEGNKER